MSGKFASLLSKTALRAPQRLLAKIWGTFKGDSTSITLGKFAMLSEQFKG
ncbi:hypothetical protein VCRA2113O215_390025 [Vibrio crassostreae]|nr:hypothetical protein EDB30_12164 [Vibrio crassostreae]TCT40999.1 hypothetical protein EDB39_1483 [Vibrio crassostreae]TCT45662.1 hypothetical protein EDB42_1281 [Vibrio crassostreae]TCT56160.1 hypothetical protein EDB44_13112 [Vibrio crassostreae]TCT69542.1 hypothetical protein EDB41_12812 [Vibrio crassostreae]